MKYFTPGPTQLSAKAHQLILAGLKADIPSLSHRSKEFSAIYERADSALRALMGVPKDYRIYFLGSATEAMERIIQNCSLMRTHHFVNGAFSERFFEVGNELGRKTSADKAAFGAGFDLASANIPSDAELICVTQNETSTGVWIPPEDLSALRAKAKDAVIAVDVVSSAPIPILPWKDIDCAFFSVQKCFGLPAGLGVLFVNEKARARATKFAADGHSTGSYHNFVSLENYAKKFQTPATPNVFSIYLLAGAAEEMVKAGIQKIRAETNSKADLIYNALSSSKRASIFVADKHFRSPTVITANVKDGSAKLVAELAAEGFEVGTGYGKLKDSQIRIANFPMHTEKDIAELLNLLR